jgi:6-phospho-3-hexuloisomerase
MIQFNMALNYKGVLEEVGRTLNTSDFSDLQNFIDKIINARKVVLFGAGRVGLMMKTFAMRLNHLNLDSYFLGDVNLPKTGLGDLIIIGSGSGNTKSVVSIAEIAKKNKLDVIAITANSHSRIANLSTSLINLNCQTKETGLLPRNSIQPMTTLFEQSLLIFLDSLVLELMNKLNEDHDSMSKRHNVIE